MQDDGKTKKYLSFSKPQPIFVMKSEDRASQAECEREARFLSIPEEAEEAEYSEDSENSENSDYSDYSENSEYSDYSD